MRSSKSSHGKSVSICTAPPTENGPCPKTDGEETEDGCSDERVHAVAAKVVEDVVRMASQAAQEKASTSYFNQPAQEDPFANTSVSPLQIRIEDTRAMSLQRLPTIQIDTVPSNPPSPTDWPPPPDDIILEEDESVDEAQIEIKFEELGTIPEEIQTFAAIYVQELLLKAMEIAEQRRQSEDSAAVREIAAQVVEDVITRATEAASERTLPASHSFPVKYAQAPEEVREFATTYVKEIISRAITMAEEKLTPTVPFNFEDVDMVKTSGPWYIRAREALIRVLRSACFCTPRRNDS